MNKVLASRELANKPFAGTGLGVSDERNSAKAGDTPCFQRARENSQEDIKSL